MVSAERASFETQRAWFEANRQVGLHVRSPVAFVDSEHPFLKVGLVCAGANRGAAAAEDDGRLSAFEIRGRACDPMELVVLSACDSEVGSNSFEAHPWSTSLAFHAAGARSVVGSHWPVDDATCATLMLAFCGSLWRDGSGPAEALRTAPIEAIRAQRQAGSDRFPCSWAAFTVVGDGR
ncbi:MAG: CHAT domain-containing protein [Planctomycetes bacterium]|nr:CHAT domain-containing protein [Planctomycetota bacterium]